MGKIRAIQPDESWEREEVGWKYFQAWRLIYTSVYVLTLLSLS